MSSSGLPATATRSASIGRDGADAIAEAQDSADIDVALISASIAFHARPGRDRRTLRRCGRAPRNRVGTEEIFTCLARARLRTSSVGAIPFSIVASASGVNVKPARLSR